MKKINKALIISLSTLLILGSITSCDMAIKQTDKSLYDILVDKTWEDILVKAPKDNTIIYYKFASEGKVGLGKLSDDCMSLEVDTVMKISWFTEGNNKLVYVIPLGYGSDTIFFNVEKYSLNKIKGFTTSNRSSNEKDFIFELCEK